MESVKVWRDTLSDRDLPRLAAPEPLPPTPEHPAEVKEVAGYEHLIAGRPASAVAQLEEAAEAYARCDRASDAEACAGIAARVVGELLPPYGHSEELKAEVQRWGRAKLRAQYEGGGDLAETDAGLDPHALEEMRLRWILRLRATCPSRSDSPLALLRGLARLTSTDLIWLAALVSLDDDPVFDAMRRHWVNDDSHYSVDFMARLLARNDAERASLLARLDVRQPLRTRGFVVVNRPAARPGTGLAHHFIELDESVVAFLSGRDFWPDAADDIARIHLPESQPGQTFLEGQLKKLDRAMSWPEQQGLSRFVALCGITRDTNMTLARVWASGLQRPLIEVCAQRLFDQPDALALSLRTVVREAMLRRACLFLDGDRRWSEVDLNGELMKLIVDLTREAGIPVLFDAGLGGEPVISDIVDPLFSVRTLPPDLDEQVVIWRDAIRHADLPELSDAAIRRQVCSSALSVEDIHRAVRLIKHNAYLAGEGDEPAEISAEELRAAAASKLNRGMHALAELVTTTLTWNNVILPDTTLEHLMEIITFARYQREVFEDWGFGRAMPYGRGNSSLFHGPPGTGKTMVAGIIARELGMDLFRIETSRVVSKYIGETEKNLGRIFDEAERGHAILLFDEADSLFAKRTEVKSSNDRYANLEVNYLLQRIEAFDGITVLTTNFRDNIDDAFSRRLRFKVEFPKPEEDDRRLMWRRMIPSSAERAPEINFGHLAKAFDFAGANIQDAVLRAAFRAAEAGMVIGERELELAGITVAKELGMLLRVQDGHVLVPGTASVTAGVPPRLASRGVGPKARCRPGRVATWTPN